MNAISGNAAMIKKRWWNCWMAHQWSMWSTLYFYKTPLCKFQSKTCLICGKVKEQKIDWREYS